MIKKILSILVVASVAAFATAQQDFDHRPSPLAGRTMLTLSLFEEVRKEIKTTPEVNTKIDGLLEKMSGDRQEALSGGGGDFDAMRSAIQKLNTKYDEEVAKFLSAEQNTRLKELFIQFNGATAITNTAVSKDLGITDDQKKKIKTAQDENGAKMREVFSNGAPEDGAKAFQKLQDDLKASLDKILTDDQRTKFKTMAGAKFEFKKVEAGGGI